MYRQLLAIILVLLCMNTFANASFPEFGCATNVKMQKSRSAELMKLVKADQDERKGWIDMTTEKIAIERKNDLIRRKRVGEIFGEGCFKTPTDYVAAALIYQHGDVPDHFYQAYIWAKRAVDLGDITEHSFLTKGKHLMALAIDRYLVNTGRKQLFGSQAMSNSYAKDGCFCLQPVEKTFPDSYRKEYTDLSLDGRYKWLASLNKGKSCPSTECDVLLQPSPKGTVPGLW